MIATRDYFSQRFSTPDTDFIDAVLLWDVPSSGEIQGSTGVYDYITTRYILSRCQEELSTEYCSLKLKTGKANHDSGLELTYISGHQNVSAGNRCKITVEKPR